MRCEVRERVLARLRCGVRELCHSGRIDSATACACSAVQCAWRIHSPPRTEGNQRLSAASRQDVPHLVPQAPGRPVGMPLRGSLGLGGAEAGHTPLQKGWLAQNQASSSACAAGFIGRYHPRSCRAPPPVFRVKVPSGSCGRRLDFSGAAALRVLCLSAVPESAPRE